MTVEWHSLDVRYDGSRRLWAAYRHRLDGTLTVTMVRSYVPSGIYSARGSVADLYAWAYVDEPLAPDPEKLT